MAGAATGAAGTAGVDGCFAADGGTGGFFSARGGSGGGFREAPGGSGGGFGGAGFDGVGAVDADTCALPALVTTSSAPNIGCVCGAAGTLTIGGTAIGASAAGVPAGGSLHGSNIPAWTFSAGRTDGV